MENLQKDFVTYNQALRLKELGFDESCFGSWETEHVEVPKYTHSISEFYKNSNHPTGKTTAPTFSQAINFLYICSNKQINIELKASDTYEERVRKVAKGCEDLRNLQNSKSN